MTDFLNLQWQGQLNEAITAITTTTDSWAASSAAGEVVCWQNEQLIYYQTAGDFSIDCLKYSADSKYLAAAGQAGNVTIWREGTLWHQISAQRAWIDRLAWHPLQPILAVAIGKQVQIWHIADRQLLATLPFDKSVICDLCWQFDGSQLAVAGYGGVAVWNWDNWQQYEMLAATSAHQVAWSSDGQFLAAATIDRQLVIAISQELERPWVIPDLPAKIHQMQWFHGESTLAIVNNQELVCWKYADDNWHPQTAEIYAAPTISIATHPHLPLIAALAVNGQDINGQDINGQNINDQNILDQNNVILIQDTDLAALEKITTEITSSGQGTLQWCRSGSHLAVGCKSGQISWWSVQL
jgi:WD40 repeat protein